MPAEPQSAGHKALTNDVFVVHGHDDLMKQHVARTLTELGLNPVILGEQPNKGRTLIEKFEANTDVSFAVILLSPDDTGNIAKRGRSGAKFRARQNVILELGYFIAALGRGNVCALKRGDIELPSDILNVSYTPYDDKGHWRLELVRELRAAGYNVDANRLMGAKSA
jgi:predicted nucleotide-binding protein